MKLTRSRQKNKSGRPKSPALDIVDLRELKKKVREIKKRKRGLYLRDTSRARDQESVDHHKKQA